MFRSDDRVLLLAIPPAKELAMLARTLMNGIVVALGDRDEVESIKRSMAEFENVMFVEAGPDRIPWRAAYFTKIVVPPHLERVLPQILQELSRVLAPGGELIHASLAV